VFGAKGPYLERHNLLLSANLRWVDSFRHFAGSAEQFQRDTLGSNVENRQRVLDISGLYQTSNQDSVSLSVPILLRGAWGRKIPAPTATTPGGQQYNYETSGLGDIAVTLRHWVLDIDHAKDGNYSIGIGVKAPTGDPHATSPFPDNTGNNIMDRPADWSIQPGTGGWGIVFDVQAFKKVKGVTLFLGGTYLAEPKDTTGVARNSTPSPTQYFSAADQYLARVGGLIPVKFVKGMTLSIGARFEATPANDFIGKDDGFRRPGHTLYIEPGLIWNRGRDTFSVYGPVAIDRRRDPNAFGQKGDATFPDYILLFGYAHRFGK
jgi:hypothetical protein